MRSTRAGRILGILSLGALVPPIFLGCAETPPPAAPPPVAVPEPVAPPAPVYDTSPVPEPADVVAIARWRSPDATIASLSACSGVPLPLAEEQIRSRIEHRMARAFHGVDGAVIGGLVAYDASVDVVSSLGEGGRGGVPEPLAAFSVGLTSLQGAKAALEANGPLVEIQPGLWRVGTREGRELSCVVGPAAGSAPARLVCGQRDRDVVTLGPYLMRTVAAAPAPAKDVHAELRFGAAFAKRGADLKRLLAFLPTLARMQSIGDARGDKALGEAASAFAGEGAALVDDLDKLSVDLAVDGNTCFTSSAALELKGQASWIAQTLLELGAKVGPPPAIFWRAPVDSEWATYGHAPDRDRVAPILRVARDLAEGLLTRDGFAAESDRKAISGLLAYPLAKETSFVVSGGHPTPAPLPPSPTEEQLVAWFTEGYGGWYMAGFDEPPAALAKLVRELVATYDRKGVNAGIRNGLTGASWLLPSLTIVPAPPKLGAGALDVEMRFVIPDLHAAAQQGAAAAAKGPKGPKGAKDRKDAKPEGTSVVLHLLLMGEPHATWIGLGSNRDGLVRRLLAAKTGAPEPATLAARPGLEPIRNGKALSSGFVTLATLTHPIDALMLSPAAALRGSSLSAMRGMLENLPHKGETPMFVSSTVAASGPGARAEVTTNVPRGSLEDMGAILLALHRLAGSAGLLPP